MPDDAFFDALRAGTLHGIDTELIFSFFFFGFVIPYMHLLASFLVINSLTAVVSYLRPLFF